MKEKETLQEYFSRVIEVVNKIKYLGDDLTDKTVCKKILISLSPKYDNMVAIIEEMKDLSSLSIHDLMGSLEMHEQRMKRHTKASLESAFQSKKFGHMQKDCRDQRREHANYTDEERNCESDGSTFFACQAAIGKNDNEWYVDSGCSNHMTGDESIFYKIDKSDTTRITMGNGAVVKSNGRGTIAVDSKTSKLLIHDVLFVPDLAQNLLSVGQLMQNNHALYFDDDYCKIFDKKNNIELIAVVKMERNRNFPLNLKPASCASMKTNVEDMS
ncbi:uncharacterized protein LOC124939357 [Impatiens glandulifera]|uniref:uncharacterized protein LOC124939357 n=1 Tax=Impatiens glandulifera TaxID=253017 RepID=UPI001FB06456|nr:uncharacterized protein LOC124939357 [Impatiens glandulifera]